MGVYLHNYISIANFATILTKNDANFVLDDSSLHHVVTSLQMQLKSFLPGVFKLEKTRKFVIDGLLGVSGDYMRTVVGSPVQMFPPQF